MYGEGRAICVGRDMDTDRIIAGRYLRTKDRTLWAAHVFEDLDPFRALPYQVPGKKIHPVSAGSPRYCTHLLAMGREDHRRFLQ